MSILPVAVLIFGCFLIYDKQITLGALIAFYTYLAYIYEPIGNLSDFNMSLQTTLGMCERVTNFLTADLERDTGIHEITGFNSLEFKNVCFSYSEDKPVLQNVSFKIDKGDKVAIIGASGSGKSTIMNLIIKTCYPYEGKITINGIDLQLIKKDSLYSNLILLEQDPFVFTGTIMENIALGDNLDSDTVNTAASISKIIDVINSHEEAYEYRISEFGSNLSGGEKQRLCLCRTLTRQAQLILLDEATSSVDANLENEIIKSLNGFLGLRQKTLIAVSHRPAILSICNKVIYLESGKINGFYDLTKEDDYQKVSELIHSPLL
ncbi:MAG: ATP-binding cassette domain-containing protein [Firmicutes bacterium]|nr:ATP-binding cassette domain-containing protein [Bacillota bacterium]